MKPTPVRRILWVIAILIALGLLMAGLAQAQPVQITDDRGRAVALDTPAAEAGALGDDLRQVLPIINREGSDSAILDNVASIIGESARSKGLSIDIDGDSVPPWLRGGGKGWAHCGRMQRCVYSGGLRIAARQKGCNSLACGRPSG